MTDRRTSDPELDATIESGTQFQLAMVKEANRHSEVNARRELGYIGRAFGGEKSAPTFVAMVAMLVGLVGAGAAGGMAAYSPDASAFWGTQLERAMAFASAALAFIFGRGSKPN